MTALQRKFLELSSRPSSGATSSNPTLLSRSSFREALSTVGVVESDTEILDRLFTMFDKSGDDQVNFREFLVGISPLVTGDVQSKIKFGLELYDIDGTGLVRPNELAFVLSSMNSTASYFGDAVMSSDQIDAAVEDVFLAVDKGKSGVLEYKEHIEVIAGHKTVVAFVGGGGTVRYGGGK